MRSDTQLIYRARRKQDNAFLVEITLATLQEVYEQSIGIPLCEELIHHQLKSSDDTIIIERNGQTIGYYSYIDQEPGRTYLGALILDPKVQQQGLGQLALSHFEEQAAKRGVRVIDGHVQKDNKQAIRFWLKNGYEVSDETVFGSYEIRKRLHPIPSNRKK